jgi:hypothetical protein
MDYHPKPGFEFLNDFLGNFALYWDTLIKFTKQILSSYDLGKETLSPVENPPHLPAALREAMHTMHRVVEGVVWLKDGDPRANIVEPQLGYALRGLEMSLQRGIGAGHGLMAILEIKK